MAINPVMKIRRTPEQYIKWVGGPHVAMANIKCFIYQCDPGFDIPPWWLQALRVCEKLLGKDKTLMKELKSKREMNKKFIELQKENRQKELDLVNAAQTLPA